VIKVTSVVCVVHHDIIHCGSVMIYRFGVSFIKYLLVLVCFKTHDN
jgi:hypothetical protein